MSKYDFDLDLVSNNSLNYIQKRIHEKSKVLEFGCANGRLTKYLKEVLNCDVTIVEIDQKAGEEAAQYASVAILGEEGNLDRDDWKSKVMHESYDYIVLADVLEHLRNPKEVLEYCKKLLKPNGSFLVSVPNLANNSVIAYLWNNQFDYHATGLLDNTHIHFFSLKSFRKLVEEIHCEMMYETATYSSIGNNEIPIHFNTVPNGLRKLLAERHLGDVYQYIFQFKNREEEEPVDVESYFIDKVERYYHTEVYYDIDGCFHEDNKIQRKLQNGKQIFDGKIEGSISNTLRFDPVNTNAIVYLEKVIVNEEVIDFSKINSNADYVLDGLFIFSSTDPNIIIHYENIHTFEIHFEIIDYDFTNMKSYNKLLELLKQKNDQWIILSDKNRDLEKAINIYEEQRTNMQNAINVYEEQRTNMQNAINDYKGQVDNYLNSEFEKNEIIKNLNKHIHELEVELSKRFSTRVYSKIKRIIKK